MSEPGRAPPSTPEQAIGWLAEQGAHPWLVRHHELVLEAARLVVDGASRLRGARFDRALVLMGAALHDAGKLEHPEEMSAPGHRHEEAGRALLARAGFAPAIARMAVTHARWGEPESQLEDRLVALADKLWKGKRDQALESALLDELTALGAGARWEVFEALDALSEEVASGAEDRLARSAV